MTGRGRLDQFDDGVRVTDPQARPIRGRTEWEHAVLREARRMRAAGEVVGHVDPTRSLTPWTSTRSTGSPRTSARS